MAKKKSTRQDRAKAKLRWRLTRIRDWRESQKPKFTQQMMADYLTALGLPLERESITRIENGTQMPSIAVLEAMAKRFGIDVDTMLNHAPGEAADLLTFKALDPRDRRRALQAYKAFTGGLE